MYKWAKMKIFVRSFEQSRQKKLDWFYCLLDSRINRLISVKFCWRPIFGRIPGNFLWFPCDMIQKGEIEMDTWQLPLVSAWHDPKTAKRFTRGFTCQFQIDCSQSRPVQGAAGHLICIVTCLGNSASSLTTVLKHPMINSG